MIGPAAVLPSAQPFFRASAARSSASSSAGDSLPLSHAWAKRVCVDELAGRQRRRPRRPRLIRQAGDARARSASDQVRRVRRRNEDRLAAAREHDLCAAARERAADAGAESAQPLKPGGSGRRQRRGKPRNLGGSQPTVVEWRAARAAGDAAPKIAAPVGLAQSRRVRSTDQRQHGVALAASGARRGSGNQRSGGTGLAHWKSPPPRRLGRNLKFFNNSR
jgi:hypothetical protein